MNVAVVGHTEWVTFAQVERLPAPGDILHANPYWDEAAGGGAVAAVELARLAGTSVFFTVVGQDAPAGLLLRALQQHNVRAEAATRAQPHPRAFTFLESTGERTITVLGHGLKPWGREPLPWERLGQMDAVYFVSGDAEALHKVRSARVVVATARILPVLAEAKVKVDVLVHSAADAGERYEDGMLPVPPAVVVTTEGAKGGRYRTQAGVAGRYEAVPLPGQKQDAYGAGDSFAAGLTFGLGAGQSLAEALAVAAASGARALCRRGALGRAP